LKKRSIVGLVVIHDRWGSLPEGRKETKNNTVIFTVPISSLLYYFEKTRNF